MQEGTKKLFPKDYQRFKEAMISAANDDDLPVCLELDDIRDYTLQDLQDAFQDFHMDTGLEMEGSLFLGNNSGRLHLQLQVNRLRRDDSYMLQ